MRMEKNWIVYAVSMALFAGVFNSRSASAKDQKDDHGRARREEHEGVIRLEQAAKIAKESFRIKSAELEKEHGRLIWSFDIVPKRSAKIVEVNVDAKTGKIVATEFESAKEEAEEANRDNRRENMEEHKGNEHKERGERFERENNEHSKKAKSSEQEEEEHEGHHRHERADEPDQD